MSVSATFTLNIAQPLCPYCYRSACQWLIAYRCRAFPTATNAPPREVCGLHGEPLPASTEQRLRRRLGLDGGAMAHFIRGLE